MSISQFHLVLDNVPGTLAEIASRLGYAGINIRGISLIAKEEKSILRMVVNDPISAERVLREAGISYSINEVIAIELPNVPGALAECAKSLGNTEINIEYLYPFISRTVNAIVILKTNDNKRAEQVLKEHNIKMLSKDELYSLE